MERVPLKKHKKVRVSKPANAPQDVSQFGKGIKLALKQGNPTTYNPEKHDKLAGDLALSGLLHQEIADELGICRRSFYIWMAKYPGFREAVKKNVDIFMSACENALLNKAFGMDYEETEETFDGDGLLEKLKVTKKKVMPDTVALMFYMKNRAPALWRETQKHEITGKDGSAVEISSAPTFDLTNLSDEDLAKFKEITTKIASAPPVIKQIE
jgi:hypothetical protein